MTALAITGASLEKFALEIRGLQKTEIGEVEEPFAQGPEGLVGDAAQAQPDRLRADLRPRAAAARQRQAAFENIALWHERDISHSSVERVILPDSFIALNHMLRRFTRIVPGMVVYPERMLENLDARAASCSRERCCSSWRAHGVSREQAYEWVQRNAMRSFHEQRDFKTLLLADPTSPACCRRPRSSGRSTSASRCATWTHLRARIRDGCSSGSNGFRRGSADTA